MHSQEEHFKNSTLNSGADVCFSNSRDIHHYGLISANFSIVIYIVIFLLFIPRAIMNRFIADTSANYLLFLSNLQLTIDHFYVSSIHLAIEFRNNNSLRTDILLVTSRYVKKNFACNNCVCIYLQTLQYLQSNHF